MKTKNNNNQTTILNVKVSNFIIYLLCFLFGIILIAASITIILKTNCNLLGEVMLSIGCSTIPTIITAYLIDQASEKRNKTKIKRLRDHFLWGMPFGVLSIMKPIVISYYSKTETNDRSLIDCFYEATNIMDNIVFNINDFESESKETNAILKSIHYGLSLCIENCEKIINQSFMMEVEEIFSKDQLLAIEYLLEECKRVQNLPKLGEVSECLELAIYNIVENIPEIKEKVVRPVVFRSGHIQNWLDIVK